MSLPKYAGGHSRGRQRCQAETSHPHDPKTAHRHWREDPHRLCPRSTPESIDEIFIVVNHLREQIIESLAHVGTTSRSPTSFKNPDRNGRRCPSSARTSARDRFSSSIQMTSMINRTCRFSVVTVGFHFPTATEKHSGALGERWAVRWAGFSKRRVRRVCAWARTIRRRPC